MGSCLFIGMLILMFILFVWDIRNDPPDEDYTNYKDKCDSYKYKL